MFAVREMRKWSIWCLFYFLAAAMPGWVLAADHDDDLLLFFDESELYVDAASRMRERVSEAPAVVTIITGRQIRELGARNLMDVLMTIPGFFEIQDTNEKVVAGRGVFATTTHKFLLMRDGHRLNDPMFEEIMPANAISLASIDRIEVLRGPGASLYGNAALLGIINIVTVDESAPGTVGVSVGNFEMVGADLVMNERLPHDRQFLFFASVRDQGGEEVLIPASQDLASNPISGIQMVEARPFNFDIGMKFVGSSSQIAASVRRAAYETPRSNDGALLTTSDNLEEIIQVFDFQHLDLQLFPKWGGYPFVLRHYADRSFLRSPQAVTTARDAPPSGKVFDLRLESSRAGVDYSTLVTHSNGFLTLGIQAESFWLHDSSIETSFGDAATLIEYPPLATVSEWNSAMYLQEKYSLGSQVILNAGLRWDYYESFGSSVSPRIAMIYSDPDQWTLKAIYGQAFQAPSYFYRTENLGLGYGSPTGLEPEELDNIQVSFEQLFDDAWVRFSAFQNSIEDFITRPSGSPTYQNVGRLTTHGIESEARITLSHRLKLTASHAWVRPVSRRTDKKLMTGGLLCNYPEYTATLGAMFEATSDISGSLVANWHSRIASPVIGPTPVQSDPNHTIDEAILLNLTLRAERLFNKVDMQLNIHNLLDERDWRGGTTRTPYPQEGRSIQLNVSHEI